MSAIRKKAGAIRYYDKVGMTTTDDVNTLSGGTSAGIKRGKVKNANKSQIKETNEPKEISIELSDDSTPALPVPKRTIKVNPIGINSTKSDAPEEEEPPK